MTKEEIIEKIKDRLLQNAIREYDNEHDRCGDYSMDKKRKEKYDTLDNSLWTERIYLMQDYDDLMNDPDWKTEELNFNYETEYV